MTDIMVQTPPILHGPSEKERKYDRQLRLWAAEGQAALENANILLVNSGCGTVGIETLKNLVLPGIGKFTIVDNSTVSDEDLGVNFFLDESSVGKSRAKCCAEFLVELNPDVQGDYFPKQNGPYDLHQLFNGNHIFTMILYTLPLPRNEVEVLHAYAHQRQIPILAVHSIGFYSYFKTTLPGTFPVVDTHPDETATTDLRLLAPWPELVDFASEMTKDIDSLDNHEHGHLPLVVILLHYLEQWKQTHSGAYPVKYADKIAFRKTISDAMRRDNPEGGEENFEEAVAAVMKHVVVPSIPDSLQQVFEYEHRDSNRAKSSFWIIVNAVKQFCAERGQLPIAGGLPDMKAQSNVYIKLQNIYKEKARRDVSDILNIIRDAPGGGDIDPAEVELFCRNVRFIKLINADGNSEVKLAQVVDEQLASDEIAAVAGPEMPLSLIPIYLSLVATSHIGNFSSEEIIQWISQQVPQMGGNERLIKTAQEVERANGFELHNISATMGGMVAQEMVKIITKQYVPIDNTCIFDGIESRCQVLRL
ncbi:hypothetical protein BGZ63DRAFT_428618 [Mariannaea sp. PMI_226]|nr:hypothetical protein BGZ63DRAFT_428618 [Mariannaea sp. PMI_226]